MRANPSAQVEGGNRGDSNLSRRKRLHKAPELMASAQPRRYDCDVEQAASPSRATGTELVVYCGTSCHLCERAKVDLDRLGPELGLTIRYVVIDGDPKLENAYRLEIPVGFLAGRKVFKYNIDEERLRRAAARVRG